MATTFLEEAIRDGAPPLVPITVDQFYLMIRNGILHDSDSIELIDGLLVRKDRSARGENVMGYNHLHSLLIKRIKRVLDSWCETLGYHLQIQSPVKLSHLNAPEPDLAIVTGTEEDYSDGHPVPADLPLVIEVGDSSVSADRSTKQRLYATAGIPVYWIVNIPDAQVEVYEQPDAASGKYLRPMIYRAGQTVHFSLADQTIDIDVTRLFA